MVRAVLGAKSCSSLLNDAEQLAVHLGCERDFSTIETSTDQWSEPDVMRRLFDDELWFPLIVIWPHTKWQKIVESPFTRAVGIRVDVLRVSEITGTTAKPDRD